MSESSDLKKYENITYSSYIKDKSLKDIPHIKPGTGHKGGLSIDKIQNLFGKISGKLPQYLTYKTFSGILAKKYPLDSSLNEDPSSKGTEGQKNKISLFRNQLALELIRLHHADALTIAGSIFLSSQKKDLSSDREKALVVHEITHLLQNERDQQRGRDADTITSNQLALELIRLHNADALTIAGSIFLSPQKKDLSSDRGKALVVHEITHLLQNERDQQRGRDADTITSSEYSEMEKEAQDAETDFLRLSMRRKLNKQTKFSASEHYYRNNVNLGGFKSENKRDTMIDKVDELSLVHPNITKIFKRIMKEDIPTLVNEGSQTLINNIGKGISLSNSVDKPSTSKKFKTQQVSLAPEGRSVYPPATAPSSDLPNTVTPSSSPSKELLDLNILAEQVYQLMSKRLIMERSRRGMR